ncbi:MAG: ATP-binding cassette domain-containing protein [Spirochaetales bacterium]|nr:ATP-binding cassette domain-containing protein [Leptospiraceae bacterium]MCP5482845.1 ATP-binding cassette domain-containing protein [Spirochaetales bacterium]
MITVQNVALRYGQRVLFDEVNLKFTPGNCYGLIGANGAGKSTFLKILSGENQDYTGEVIIPSDERMAVLRQNHYEYDEYPVLETVVMGHRKLYKIQKERDALYSQAEMSDADGIRAAELEEEFAELGGYEAEAQAGAMLEGLGVMVELHQKRMQELNDNEKVRVLLAQALFGDPDILLLDEPTNHLDVESVIWLENFLYEFKNTVIVVSHDRHFLNQVCTHIVDIDFSRMRLYVGNYDFWYQSSQLILKQRKDENKKKEDKIKELKEFIQRFSSNASKARQATSRKKLLDKIQIEDLQPSTRRYPYINFKPEREAGKEVLTVENLGKQVDGEWLLKDISFRLDKEDKVVLVGGTGNARSVLFDVLMGVIEPDAGELRWGQTITPAYFPREYDHFFEKQVNLIDWLRQFSKDQEEGYIRGFLGRMLFSGEEALKTCDVLSGGEKVRCMFSRMMLQNANLLIFDEPTHHLDLESITALNQALQEFPGAILFTTVDHELAQTVANRVFDLSNGKFVDRKTTYDEFIAEKRAHSSGARAEAVH